MNTANLKTYAPQARKDFLTAVTNRALKLGISEKGNAEVTVQGDLMLIGGTAYPRTLDAQRNQLIKKIQKSGFAYVMEEAAYTWFNRFMAIRYMEVHGYFAHGYRVLSNPSGGNQPEILQQAQSVTIPGLDKKRVVELLSQGNQQEELYRTLILAQSKALGQTMPFLFDTIDTSTELLLPDGLLAPQSVMRKLVSDIPEDDWQSNEILGWLYQFYVSDEKARVDALVKKGQAVQPEDIPAKTQLFTPNWIVQFMTQNSLGRLWMDVYPDSPLAGKMPYYTAPADQEPEVAAKLREITPSALDPNTLTAIDPAAGSGHILLVLYDLFYEFYREQGYQPSEIPRLIVSQNLYGLELDRRAAQIAGFAVLMRARQDDPTLLVKPPTVNVLSLVPSLGMNADVIAETLLAPIRGGATIAPEDGLFPELNIQPRLVEAADGVMSKANKADVKALIVLFEEADVCGSLIRVPATLAKKLPALRDLVRVNLCVADLDRQATARELSPLLLQAEMLAAQYTVCVANPPYLGGRQLTKELKEFANSNYPDSSVDLFAMFISRAMDFAAESGFLALVTMESWMFLSSLCALRERILTKTTIASVMHLQQGVYGGFGTVAFSARNIANTGNRASFSFIPRDAKEDPLGGLRTGNARTGVRPQSIFLTVPGFPLAYWETDSFFASFSKGRSLQSVLKPTGGMTTGDNARFIRRWYEVSKSRIGFGLPDRDAARSSRLRWFPYNKGGEARRWYGNQEFVVNWEDDGRDITAYGRSYQLSKSKYFHPSLTWSDITSSSFTARYSPQGFIFDKKGSSGFPLEKEVLYCLALLCSDAMYCFMKAVNPTVTFQVGDIGRFPVIDLGIDRDLVVEHVQNAVRLSRDEWNASETSWNFERLVGCGDGAQCALEAYTRFESFYARIIEGLKFHEVSMNNLISRHYGYNLAAHPSLPPPAIGITEPSQSRWGREAISYFVGCTLGRYSLDEVGLIYGGSQNQGFAPNRYHAFPADQDGILPITEGDFFGEEDIANRLARWVKTVWSNSPLEKNLDFIADALGQKANESSLEAIRRYLATDFYKAHLKTYKKRPIYWLFSSGKHRAFQALVYLHRYNESTLSTMRSDYVTPLFGKLSAQINAAEAATETGSTSDRKTAAKRLEKLRNQQAELIEFDRRLHYYALQRISLDLDEGVKANYGKFSSPTIGDILANVKDITGGEDE